MPTKDQPPGHTTSGDKVQAPELVPARPLGSDADLVEQKVKILAGRYSPKSHLERDGMKKK